MTDHFCPIDHIAIDAVDFDTALAFFKDVFGMTVTRFQGPEEAPTSLWLDGGVQLCRVEAQAADTGRVGHIAFKTDDLDGLLDLKIPQALIDQALSTIQSLDPAGVGARSLS